MKYKPITSKILLLLIMTIYCFSFIAVFAQSTNDLLIKAGKELYQKIESLDDDEKIALFIWKTPINDEEYKDELLSLGFDEEIYGNEDQFQSEIASKLQEANNYDRIKEIRKEYKIARLQAIKNVTIATNKKFLNDYDIDFVDVIYLGSYTSTVIISISKKQVHLVISDQRILGISLYEDKKLNNQLQISVDQVNAGYGTVQNPGLKNASQGGYDGTGVSIGIIEAESGRFDPDAPQLSSMVSSGQLEFIEVQGVSESISDHATHVTNIIAGQSYSYSGNTYEGIATGAQIYQSAIVNFYDLFTAFSQFADLGVDVINSSLGFETTGYSPYDQEIDNLIYIAQKLYM